MNLLLSLEEELTELSGRVTEAEKFEAPKILQLSEDDIHEFADEWRNAVFRELVDSVKDDDDAVEIIPSYH